MSKIDLLQLLRNLPDEKVLALWHGLVKKKSYRYEGLDFATNHTVHMFSDPSFVEAAEKVESLGLDCTVRGERFYARGADWYNKYIALWCSQFAVSNSLDMIEFGVMNGSTSYTICNYYGEKRQGKFYLVDTFCGIPSENLRSDEMEMLNKNGRLYPVESNADVVKRNFSCFSNIEVVEGRVPEILVNIPDTQFGYCHIDMNNVHAEMAAINWVWDRLASGARVLLDDYGWPKHKNQRDAFDSFAQEKGLMVLSLPTGQGVIIKQ